jgi:glutamate-ammonia-ligase adenylyltransferase
MKARVIAGDGDGVMALVEPFVYRRYLDYGLLASLRELHTRIFETAIQRRKADDIKVGAGGIREIEFAVQLFQLVRGGRDRGLQMTSTRAALAAIAERGLIEPARAQALGHAYAFLRRLEHRLQYYDDQQTQALPRGDEHRARIAEAMDFPDWDALFAALERHRTEVQAAFNTLFEGTPRPANPAAASLVASLTDPQSAPETATVVEDLAEAGIPDAGQGADRLIEFTRSRRFRAMSAATRAKVEKLLAALVSASVEAGNASVTFVRLLQLLEGIDRREAYFSLLIEYPQVLARAAYLVSRSAWAARLLARHPILLDELTRSAASFTATDWSDERRWLMTECESHGEDLERVLEELRHFKQRHVLRLTIADVEGELPVMALSDELSALADTLLEVTLALAARNVIPGAAGAPVIPGAAGSGNGPGSNLGFIVVGYGKLGGKELGYGSDLDIVFLYDGETGAEHGAKIAQRVITWVTSLTPAGVLYETDLRLRPDGAKGVMVSSLAGFANYQRTRAWTWEHQALTRARFSAGDPELGARFERVKDEILATPRDREKVLTDIRAMRGEDASGAAEGSRTSSSTSKAA